MSLRPVISYGDGRAMINNKNEQYWSDHAEVYDTQIDTVIGRESRAAVYDFLLGLRSLGNTIEFGCGPGYFTRAVAKNATHILAIDISQQMLDRAKANLAGISNVSFRKADCEHTPLPDNSFDTVFTANVVQVLEHPGQAMNEAFRILKPGGKLVLLFYSFDSLGLFDRFMMMIRFMSRFHGVPYKNMMSVDEIRAMAEKSGFMIDDLRLIGGKLKAIYLLARKPA